MVIRPGEIHIPAEAVNIGIMTQDLPQLPPSDYRPKLSSFAGVLIGLWILALTACGPSDDSSASTKSDGETPQPGGADPNATIDKSTLTPLHRAVTTNDLALAKLLLRNGVLVRKPLLNHAVRKDNEQMIALLKSRHGP